MVVNDKLIYLQMQKTGCSHIAKLILQTVGGKQEGKHYNLYDYNTGKYIIGSVRNPWDWYISLWAFGCSGKGAFRRYVANTSGIQLKHLRHPFYLMRQFIDFSPIYFMRQFMNSLPIRLWEKTYADVYEPELFRDWLKLVYDPQRKYDLKEGYAAHPVSGFCGFMTYRYCRLYLKNFYDLKVKKLLHNMSNLKKYDANNHLPDKMIRTESLEDDLISALSETGFMLNESQVKYIYDAERVNTSMHRERQFYYDEETRGLVLQKEKYLIDKYNYTFD